MMCVKGKHGSAWSTARHASVLSPSYTMKVQCTYVNLNAGDMGRHTNVTPASSCRSYAECRLRFSLL